MTEYKIGIDVGGTFTDFLLTSQDGASKIYKVLSTPEDPSLGLLNGLSEMAEYHDVPLREFIKRVTTIVHGTTVTTNAVLTRKGAKKRPFYRIVAADSEAPRDGRFLEVIGHYNPQTDPAQISIDEEKVTKWLRRGAKVSETVRSLLRKKEVSKVSSQTS